MFREYAVEPCVSDDPRDIASCLKEFSIFEGRMLACVPGKWKRAFWKHINQQDLRPLEKKILEHAIEKVQKQHGFLKRGVSFDPDQSWVENALTADSLQPFSWIITRDPSNANEKIVDFSHAGDKCFDPVRMKTVPRTAENIANTLVGLLRGAKRVVIADPHFDPAKHKWWKVIRALRDKIENPSIEFEYHFDYATTELERHQFEEVAARFRVEYLNPGEVVEFCGWETARGTKFHDRFLLTEKAAVASSYGFDEGREGEETRLDILDRPAYESAYQIFDKSHFPEDHPNKWSLKYSLLISG